MLSGPVAKGTVVSLLIRLAGIGLGLVQAILTARLLGPEGYGMTAFVLSVSIVAATLVLFGTEPLAVREVARYAAARDHAGLAGFVRSIRIVLFGVSLLGAGAVTAFFATAPQAAEYRSVALYAVLIFPLIALVLQSQGVLRGLGHTALSQLPFFVLRPAVLVGVLAVCFVTGTGIGPEGYLNAVLAGTALALLWAGWSVLRLTPKGDAPARRHPPPSVVRASAPFLAISVTGLLLVEANTLMLAWWTTPEETGLFQPIARIAPLMMLGTTAAAVRYGPRVSELWARGETERLAAVTQTFVRTTTAFTFALTAPILILGDWLLGLYGEAFRVNVPALWWVAGAQLFNAACGPAFSLLTMTGHARHVAISQALGLAVQVGLAAVLIPAHGGLGAAMAMAGGIVVWSAALLIQVWRLLPIEPSLLGLFRR